MFNNTTIDTLTTINTISTSTRDILTSNMVSTSSMLQVNIATSISPSTLSMNVINTTITPTEFVIPTIPTEYNKLQNLWDKLQNIDIPVIEDLLPKNIISSFIIAIASMVILLSLCLLGCIIMSTVKTVDELNTNGCSNDSGES